MSMRSCILQELDDHATGHTHPTMICCTLTIRVTAAGAASEQSQFRNTFKTQQVEDWNCAVKVSAVTG